MHLAYPIVLTPDGDGWLVTSPDFPELTSDGDGHDEALANASDALVGVIGMYIDGRRDIPSPSQADGRPMVAVPLLIAAKAALWQAMRDQRVTRVALAARLGMDESQVRRMLDIGHRSHIGDIERALKALGRKPVLALDAAA